MTTSGIIDQVQFRVQKILDDREVQNTLMRIEKDAPGYNKDGAIFMNRERLLPVQEDKSYYSEWTVKTPGESDRGARRIIEGK
jgi:ribonuclease T1